MLGLSSCWRIIYFLLVGFLIMYVLSCHTGHWTREHSGEGGQDGIESRTEGHPSIMHGLKGRGARGTGQFSPSGRGAYSLENLGSGLTAFGQQRLCIRPRLCYGPGIIVMNEYEAFMEDQSFPLFKPREVMPQGTKCSTATDAVRR